MNRRKLSSGVMRLIVAFSILVIGIVAGLSIAAISSGSDDEMDFIVNSDCVAYDEAGNQIILDSSATVYKSWTGEWILKDSKSKIYNLGKNTAIYDDGVLKIFGGGYQILDEDEVVELDRYNELSDLANPGFFKLADRRYLMTGSRIGGDNNPINTSKYVFIVMDKSGNAMLLNGDVCKKTKSATVLDGTNYKFDIANEKLIFGEDDSIDLKKIIGSTNEYDAGEDVDLMRKKAAEYEEKGYTTNPEEIILDLSGGDGGDGGIGGYGGDGGIGGTGGGGGIGGTGGNGGIGGKGGDGGEGQVPEVTDARKTMNIYGVTANYTSAIVRYNVNDPYGQLGDPYFDIYKQGASGTYEHFKSEYVDIDGSEVTLFDLTPNTKYKIDFCQTVNSTGNNAVVTYYFTTKNAGIEIIPIEVDETYFICKVRYTEGLSFTKATLNITQKDSSGNWIVAPFASKQVPISASSLDGVQMKFTSTEGWTALSQKSTKLKLFFTDVEYDNAPMSVTTIQEIANPYSGKDAWDSFISVHSSYCVYTYNPTAVGRARTNYLEQTDTVDQMLVKLSSIKNVILQYKTTFGEEKSYWDKDNYFDTWQQIRTVVEEAIVEAGGSLPS